MLVKKNREPTTESNIKRIISKLQNLMYLRYILHLVLNYGFIYMK